VSLEGVIEENVIHSKVIRNPQNKGTQVKAISGWMIPSLPKRKNKYHQEQ
jgi:hypothetical protein